MTTIQKHIDSADRRQHRRRQTFMPGTVTVAGRTTLRCVIRNISDGGALIVLEQPQILPYGFLLEIDGQDDVYNCEIRHHHGVKIGVEFVTFAAFYDGNGPLYGGEIGSWVETSNHMPELNWP